MKKNNENEVSLNKTNKVPKLKFSNLQIWHFAKMNDLIIFLRGKEITKKDLSPTGEMCITYGELYTNYLGKIEEIVSKTTKKNNAFFSKKGDVIIPSTGETKNDISNTAVVPLDNIILGSDIIVMRPKTSLINSLFLSYQLSGTRRKDIYKLAKGATIIHININDLKNIMIYFPSIDDQFKIQNFINLLQEKINVLAKKIKALKLYKKGLTHHLLKKSIISWAKQDYSNSIKLKKILFEHKEYSINNGKYIHVTLSKEGIFSKTERYNRDFLVKTENKKYKITKKGDICYNPANLKFGVITLNKYGDGIFSPIYITFSTLKSINKQYLISLLQDQNFINYSMKFEEGTVYERRSVSVKDFLNISLFLETKELQFKYAEILQKIERLSIIYNNRIQLIHTIKNNLIKNMFI